MALSVFLHIVFIGLWGGCLATEAVVEAWGRRGPAEARSAAELHYWIDLAVEAPALVGVLITGASMVDWSHVAGLIAVKATAGVLAVAVNAWCIGVVVRRRGAARRGDGEGVRQGSRLVLVAIVVGAPPFLAALGIGLHLAGFL